MQTPHIDDLILLPQDEAIQKYFDAKNYHALRSFLIFWSVILLIIAIITLVEHEFIRFLPVAAHGLLIYLYFRYGNHPDVVEHFRQLTIYFLLLQFVLISLYAYDGGSVSGAAFMAIIPLFWLRFKTVEYQQLIGIPWIVAVITYLIQVAALDLPSGEDVANLIALTVFSGVVYGVAINVTRKKTKQFLAQWTVEYERNHDRLRMKQELEHAHEIQMSMLPQTKPDIAGFDLASLSLPATEVGGDYYDYFPLSDSRLAVAIGDVSGHGVASGLVLSGVRSGLYVLHDTDRQAKDILERLNRMVKKTTDRRMFVTFLYAIFDHERKQLTFSSAGQPPLVWYDSTSSTVREIELKALPLGALFETTFEEKLVPYHTGDVFVMYSDGLTESTNKHHEEYGADRLHQQLQQVAAQGKSAHHIRDALLNDVWNFKGDQDQKDDITMVVIKIR